MQHLIIQVTRRSSHCAGSAASSILGKECLVGGFAGLESSREGELGADAFDAVSRVHVLDKGDLVAGCGALTRDDGGVGKEVFPDLFLLAAIRKGLEDQAYSVPSVAILRHDLLLVGEPVSIPSPESSRVVDTNSINHLNFEPGAL